MIATLPDPYPPLPTKRPTWSEFWIPSAAGAPGPTRAPNGAVSGNGRWHAGLDWFAPAGTVCRAMVAGQIIESRGGPSGTSRVYGGVVKILHGLSGTVWVYRHVNPSVPVGAAVSAGDPVALVAPWAGGSPHAHLEVWRTRAGGYQVQNMIDPWGLSYVARTNGRPWPPPHGNTLRLVLATPAEIASGRSRSYAGWAECRGPIEWIAQNGLDRDTSASIAWRGNVWRGPDNVTGVCRSLVARFL